MLTHRFWLARPCCSPFCSDTRAFWAAGRLPRLCHPASICQNPVQDLSAVRVGNSVRLSWTTPLRTTDKVLLRSPIAAQVCRSVQDAACIPIADLNLPPGKPAMYTDDLPADLLQAADRLLRYEVVAAQPRRQISGAFECCLQRSGHQSTSRKRAHLPDSDRRSASQLATNARARAIGDLPHRADGSHACAGPATCTIATRRPLAPRPANVGRPHGRWG